MSDEETTIAAPPPPAGSEGWDDYMNALWSAATRYTSLGWSVIPLLLSTKTPALKWEQFQHRQPTEEEITEWTTDGVPDGNGGYTKAFGLAIVTGEISGLVVVDCDNQDAVSYAINEAGLFSVFSVKTTRGQHMYFKHPKGGKRISNKVGNVGIDWPKVDGLDLRGDGGYVVAPPSVKFDKQGQLVHTYQFNFPDEELDQFAGFMPTYPGVNIRKSTARPISSEEWSFDTLSLVDVRAYGATVWDDAKKRVDTSGRKFRDGDGRNSWMTRYIGECVASGMDETQAREAARQFQLEFFETELPVVESETVLRSVISTDKRNHPDKYEALEKWENKSPERQERAKAIRCITPHNLAELRARSAGRKYLIDPYVAPGSIVQVVGFNGHGKALALDTEIPTPGGWKTMGDMRVGDVVFDMDGRPCNVVAVTEVMSNRPCFRVTFGTGETVVADANHEWVVRTYSNRSVMNASRQKGREVDRFEILKTTDMADAVRTKGGLLNFSVSNSGPVEFPEAELPISPYTLGAWLGDGTSTCGQITKPDAELFERIQAEGWALGDVIQNGMTRNVKGLAAELKKHGLLNNKHIPSVYLTASLEQRLALIQGLMDTDGFVAVGGTCEFSNNNKALAEGLRDLVLSMGCQANILERRAMLYGKDCGPNYRVTFTPSFEACTLPRKRERLHVGASARRIKHRFITAIEPVESVPVKCIQVDSPSHTYLVTRSFIPTHNSLVLLNMMWAAGLGKSFGPATIEAPVSVLYIDGESAEGTLVARINDCELMLGKMPETLSIWSSSVSGEDMSLREAAGLAKLSDMINEHKPQIVVIDTVRQAFQGMEENSPHAWVTVNQIAMSCRNAGMAVILVHHRNKPDSNGHGREAGSTAQLKDLDTQIFVTKVTLNDDQAKREAAIPNAVTKIEDSAGNKHTAWSYLGQLATVASPSCKLKMVFELSFGKLRQSTENHVTTYVGLSEDSSSGHWHVVHSMTPRQKAGRLAANGMAAADIADKLSVSLPTVRQWIASTVQPNQNAS